eukprot:763230-Hanusia_phi.AAC.2
MTDCREGAYARQKRYLLLAPPLLSALLCLLLASEHGSRPQVLAPQGFSGDPTMPSRMDGQWQDGAGRGFLGRSGEPLRPVGMSGKELWHAAEHGISRLEEMSKEKGAGKQRGDEEEEMSSGAGGRSEEIAANRREAHADQVEPLERGERRQVSDLARIRRSVYGIKDELRDVEAEVRRRWWRRRERQG